ncbi:Stf0 family sulfotransferase [Nocardioides bizhenqiangii]|uniref:Stf0 family sulfotransferase n=1 Tax=Nocardioides bizhenqiangii TaxID=3095076 RepID=A0ABZ0ZUR2_9ACTN|nr:MULTISPECIES: Stf0 family sulfotransferase [unclassified Nocardioides]MDZ5623100.1 Stf0 family sulfotransferase [Nocardioides sp. HM23]WQQ28076.1 Stf0 family sulfotransferase [Nocardioides sp. HM61]
MSERPPEAGFEHLHSLTLVLSSARSGSTLLCHDIASLGGLGMAKEYLRGLRTEPRTTTATEADVLERVAMGVREDAPGVASVKLLVPQTPVVFEALSGRRIPSVEALPGVIDWTQKRFERVFMVFLVRNAIDQAISRVVADATGVFHSSNSAFGDLASAPLRIPDINQRILDNLGRVVRDRNILLAVHAQFAELGLLLTYDELNRQPDAIARKLAAHARKAGFEVQRETSTRKLEKVISAERSTEIREAFLDYLKNETGVVPGDLDAARPRVAASDE